MTGAGGGNDGISVASDGVEIELRLAPARARTAPILAPRAAWRPRATRIAIPMAREVNPSNTTVGLPYACSKRLVIILQGKCKLWRSRAPCTLSPWSVVTHMTSYSPRPGGLSPQLGCSPGSLPCCDTRSCPHINAKVDYTSPRCVPRTNGGETEPGYGSAVCLAGANR